MPSSLRTSTPACSCPRAGEDFLIEEQNSLRCSTRRSHRSGPREKSQLPCDAEARHSLLRAPLPGWPHYEVREQLLAEIRRHVSRGRCSGCTWEKTPVRGVQAEMADVAVAHRSRQPVVVLLARVSSHPRLWNVGAIGLLVCIAALHAWSLLRFPAPFVDEAWTASRGWALVSRGEMMGSLDKGVVDLPAQLGSFSLLPTLVHASALAIAGAPSLFAVRLVSLMGGAALALALWFIASRFRGPGTAWLAVVLLTVSRPFVRPATWLAQTCSPPP